MKRRNEKRGSPVLSAVIPGEEEEVVMCGDSTASLK